MNLNQCMRSMDRETQTSAVSRYKFTWEIIEETDGIVASLKAIQDLMKPISFSSFLIALIAK